MASYQIISDSCCDFTLQQYQANNVLCVPLTVVYNGEAHNNFTDEADVKAFYDVLRTGVTATTSAVNPEGWTKVMEPVLQEGKDLLVFGFTSALSATYQSLVIAAEELREKYPQRKINIVDSLCAALGQGLLIWYACKKRDAGMSLEEVTAWAEENKHHICHWVTVDDLSHLKRGGRISGATAFVGTMLNIKPIIHIDEEGRLVNVGKCRGRKAATEFIAAKVTELGEDFDNSTVFVAHGDCPEDAEALAKILKEKHGVKEVITGYVGPVIGAHTGPGVLVVFFMGKNR